MSHEPFRLSATTALLASLVAWGCGQELDRSQARRASEVAECRDCYAVYDDCVNGGGDEVECAIALDACLPPPPDWITACEHCFDEHWECTGFGEVNLTQEQADACDAALDACVAECPAPPPDPCEACYQELDACQLDGGDIDACSDAALPCIAECTPTEDEC